MYFIFLSSYTTIVNTTHLITIGITISAPTSFLQYARFLHYGDSYNVNADNKDNEFA